MLERGTGLIKLLQPPFIAIVQRLLGTITSMILTFQAIKPAFQYKVLEIDGRRYFAKPWSPPRYSVLMVAIPLLFGHSLVTTLSHAIVQRLSGDISKHLAAPEEGAGTTRRVYPSVAELPNPVDGFRAFIELGGPVMLGYPRCLPAAMAADAWSASGS